MRKFNDKDRVSIVSIAAAITAGMFKNGVLDAVRPEAVMFMATKIYVSADPVFRALENDGSLLTKTVDEACAALKPLMESFYASVVAETAPAPAAPAPAPAPGPVATPPADPAAPQTDADKLKTALG